MAENNSDITVQSVQENNTTEDSIETINCTSTKEIDSIQEDVTQPSKNNIETNENYSNEDMDSAELADSNDNKDNYTESNESTLIDKLDDEKVENLKDSPTKELVTKDDESITATDDDTTKNNEENLNNQIVEAEIENVDDDVSISKNSTTLKEVLEVVHENVDTEENEQNVSLYGEIAEEKEDKESSKVNNDSITDAKTKEIDISTEDIENVDNIDEPKIIIDVSITTLDRPRSRTNSVDRMAIDNADDSSEVGIVGPPTAVSELINEAELRSESNLPLDEKNPNHVAEWVEKSAKTDITTIEIDDDECEEKPCEIIEDRAEEKSKKAKHSEMVLVPVRKSQRIVSNIIKKSIKCLNNKMHAMEGTVGNGKKIESTEKTREEDDTSRASPKVPQSQQNGAALPEEAAVTAICSSRDNFLKIEPMPLRNVMPKVECDSDKLSTESDGESRGRKRKQANAALASNGSVTPTKKSCSDRRDIVVSSLEGTEKLNAEELAAKADELRSEVQALDELARAKELEWNEILTMRKIKEEAYLKIERRRQVVCFMTDSSQSNETLPPASLTLNPEWELSKTSSNKYIESKPGNVEEEVRAIVYKRDRHGKSIALRHSNSYKQIESSRKQSSEAQAQDNRHIGEGRQGAIVNVKSIIADHRLRHPETVPRRGRRMRNSVNLGLGTGGAMMETGQNVDSRPSSTDSVKSNPNVIESNNSMSFKDVLVQFAKLSQQQGEAVKTPQNYPDVTLHPVAPSTATQNSVPQQTGSLLHGILTKTQSPRPTTFSPTLARLLTAPERERNNPSISPMPPQNLASQHHILQAYQTPNPVSISDLLSSSKARTEITITPVVNTSSSHSNSLLHMQDDVEEESAVIEDREARIAGGRDDREPPPSCQGCNERPAQFVCAGCGNQWYCSRECQVAAWDDHSEVCSG